MKSLEDFIIRINKNKTIFDNLKKDNLLFWGCGNTAELYKFCFEKERIYPHYFVDNNPQKQHTKFIKGIEVISPDEIKLRVSHPIVFIVSANIGVKTAVLNYCRSQCFFVVSIDEYVFYKNQQQIIDNYHNLADDFSKNIYLEVIFSRIDSFEIGEEYVSDNQYFCLREFLHRENNEVFVDCGAYVGDSLETYIWKKAGVFQKIYAFEPDPANFDAMMKRIDRLNAEWGFDNDKIIAENMGLDCKEYSVSLSSSGSSLSAHINDEKAGKEVCITTLDSYFENQKVSFIKADIESYETKLLEGSRHIIQRDHPLLAICIYHNASDFYQIQKMISEIDSSYRFSIRHHTFMELETLLYAY